MRERGSLERVAFNHALVRDHIDKIAQRTVSNDSHPIDLIAVLTKHQPGTLADENRMPTSFKQQRDHDLGVARLGLERLRALLARLKIDRVEFFSVVIWKHGPQIPAHAAFGRVLQFDAVELFHPGQHRQTFFFRDRVTVTAVPNPKAGIDDRQTGKPNPFRAGHAVPCS